MQKGSAVAMAIFIPEKLGMAGAKALQIKRVLSQLDDSYVVRMPLPRQRSAQWLPDFLLQRGQDWLVIAISEASFASLAEEQLFGDAQRKAFETLLAGLQAFAADDVKPDERPLKKLVLMWQCSTEQVQYLMARWGRPYGVVLLSRDAFKAGGAQLIARVLEPLSARQSNAVLVRYFPETHIHPIATTRRLFCRDNSATLQQYFLDYDQEWAAKLDLEQPQEQEASSKDFALRLINGVAGSGKTLIAVSRALLLAEMHPQQQVLLLIHNAPVVADIQAKLARMRRELPANLQISTFFAWARKQWKRLYQGEPHCVSSHEALLAIAQHRRRWPELTQSSSLLLEELDFINESLLTSEQAYCQANRAGRGFGLRERERLAIWGLYQAVTDHWGEKAMLWSALPKAICLAPGHHRLQKAGHILIDEAQFFAPSWFQAVRLSLQEHGSLFLCADPNQGFMKSRLSWKSVGFEVAGRTKKLRRSYRTTQAILSAANRLLQHGTSGDPDDYLQPNMAGMEPGLPPRWLHCASMQDAIDRLGNEIHAACSSAGVQLNDMLVVYGDRVHAASLYAQLSRRLGADAVWWFNNTQTRRRPPKGYEKQYLRMSSVESATGLEAGVVFLVGMESLLSTAAENGTADDHEQKAAETEERMRKLYMAMTRAGQALVLLSTEPASALLSQALNHSGRAQVRKTQP
ncbi:DUF2075 domain-containing protein [Comamonadaceae bacterium OH2310_COT-174]|nr:DUF2075 domain-containing protein [Comamonadaceae bacterium OH2310_COT-174]